MSPMTPSWQSISADFAADGALRDIYVFDTDEAAWSQFLGELRASDYPCSYFYGGKPMGRSIDRFEDAAALQQSDSVLLAIMVGPVQVNCHFFTPEEIELDIDPREVTDESRYQALLGFLRWLAAVLAKPVSLTYENSEEPEILHVTPEGEITTGGS